MLHYFESVGSIKSSGNKHEFHGQDHEVVNRGNENFPSIKKGNRKATRNESKSTTSDTIERVTSLNSTRHEHISSDNYFFAFLSTGYLIPRFSKQEFKESKTGIITMLQCECGKLWDKPVPDGTLKYIQKRIK